MKQYTYISPSNIYDTIKIVNATFMTGFGVSAANGYPDTQLVSYNEMLSSANSVAEGLSSAALEVAKYGEEGGEETESSSPPIAIPCIADGDTGYVSSYDLYNFIASAYKSLVYRFIMNVHLMHTNMVHIKHILQLLMLTTFITIFIPGQCYQCKAYRIWLCSSRYGRNDDRRSGFTKEMWSCCRQVCCSI